MCAANVKGKTFSVGTLVYTLSGLLILCSLLLLADFAYQLKDRAIAQVLPLLLNKFQASNTLISLLTGTLPQIIVLLILPAISLISDRYRSRWGRRLPFAVLPTPLIVVSMVCIAFAPNLGEMLHTWLGGHSPGLMPITLAVISVSWVLFEFGTIIADAMVGALVNDVVPAAVMGRFFAFFRAASLAAGVLFNYYLMGKSETYFHWIFLGMAGIYLVAFTLLGVFVKEGQYPPPPPLTSGDKKKMLLVAGVKSYFRDCYSKPFYLLLFMANVLAAMPILISGTFNTLFAKSMAVDMDTYGKLTALTYGISFVLAFPIGMLADRFHPLRLQLILTVLCSACHVGMFLFIRDSLSFNVWYVISIVLAGAFWTGTASLSQRMLPAAKFMQFSSAGVVLSSVVRMILSPIAGWGLDLTGSQYRYVYLFTAVIAAGAVILCILCYRNFRAQGGDKHYTAPE